MLMVVTVVFGLFLIDLANELLCHIDLVNAPACIFDWERRVARCKYRAQSFWDMNEFYVVFLYENVDHKEWWDVPNKEKTEFREFSI
jgi:hypothetical protein